MSQIFKTLILIILLNAVPLSAYAQSEDNPQSLWYRDNADPGWYFDAEVGLEYEPAYTGSDNYASGLDIGARAIYVSNAGHRYFLTLGELGAVFKLGDNTLLGTVLEYEEGRNNDDDPILSGFPEVENTVEAQISLTRRWGNWSAALVAQPDILDRGKGFVYFAGLEYDTRLSDRWRVGASLDISFSDAEHINTEVGISQSTAALTGLPAYEANGGYKSTTIGIGTGYRLGRNWELLLNGELELYGSEMKNSPLIAQEGDDVNYELGMALRYEFGR